jgi:hypothetical protein
MTMASKKKAGKKTAGMKWARLRDLSRNARGQAELTDEQARHVKGGVLAARKAGKEQQ